MEQLKQVIQTMIQLSDWEFDTFYSGCQCFTHKKNDIISRQNVVPNEIFFVQKGLIPLRWICNPAENICNPAENK
jgi:hypothetical protein